MIDRIIDRQRRTASESILRYYRERYHPHALLVPNGRFGLYAAARELLRPGDRVIVSPVTCRTVIQALLAAGVCPVLVDIEPETGNIDASKLSASLLESVRAIVTTNLYGNPDSALELRRAASAHNLLLIEDCAHVLQSRIGGRLVGSIGDVSVFSFKKYFDEPGGAVTLRSAEAARKVAGRIAAETDPRPQSDERLRYLQYLVAQAAPASVVARLSAVHARLHGPSAAAASPARDVPPGPPPKAQLPTTASLLRVAAYLSRSERLISDRAAAAASLISNCPLELKKSPGAQDVCYLVVPFFSSRRDAVVAALRQRGIPTYFLYSPPMNEVFSQLDSTRPLDRDLIRHWCGNILPIDPRFSREYLESIQSLSRSHDNHSESLQIA